MFTSIGRDEMVCPEQRSEESGGQRLPLALVIGESDQFAADMAKRLRGRLAITTCASAHDALDLLTEHEVSLVLCDRRVPGHVGLDFLRQAMIVKPEVGAILVVERSDIREVLEAADEGAVYYYVHMPIDSTELDKAVTRALAFNEVKKERHRLLREIRQTYQIASSSRKRKHELAEKVDALEILHQAKTEFLMMAAHDLRNPIGNILGMAELIHDQRIKMTREERLELVERISAMSRGMLELLTDLLDVARIASGKLEVDPKPVSIAPYIARIERYNRTMADCKRIRFSTSVADGLPPAVLDADQMQQVLNNLLSNAFKYSAPGTRVTLDARPVENGVQFCVADEGQGIPKEHMDHLFRAFHRAGGHPTGDEHSTGLGLYICRKIVELHRGEIRAESELGHGTRVYVTLPCAEGAPQNQARV
jgi:signal transduction histidine kinase